VPDPTSTVPDPTSTVPDPTSNSGPCSVTLNFTTVSYGGQFGPDHVEAAWVTDAAGAYIHTLEAYGTIRIRNLTNWEAASGGNPVDAVTGATIHQHRAHTVTWDCVDLQGSPVPDGAYKILAEFTEDDSAGFFGVPTKNISVDFTKGPDPMNTTVPDQNSFTAISLSYQ
jgi:hypothetical protein